MRNGNKNFRYQTIVFSLIFIFSNLLSIETIYSYSTSTSFPIGGNWKVVTEAKLGEIDNFSANGKWIVWQEIKLDPNHYVGEGIRGSHYLYYTKIYRKNIDSSETDTILEPNMPRSGRREEYLSGENGLICTFYMNQDFQIFIPGQNPQKIDIPSDGKDYELMYLSQQGYILKIMDWASYTSKPQLKIVCPLPSLISEKKLEVKIADSNSTIQEYYGSSWYGSSFLYKKSRNLFLYDLNSQKDICIFSNPMKFNLEIVGLDKNFAYFCISTIDDQIYRTELSGRHLTQQYKLPSAFRYIDFHQPFLLGLFEFITDGKARFSPGLFNIYTGELKEFKTDLPSNYFYSSTWNVCPTSDYREKAYIRRREDRKIYWVTGDAEYGYIITLFENKIYMLNELKTITNKRSNWEPIENNPQ